MEAIIVKDDDLKTMGFEVTANGQTIFSWGVSPKSSFYYTKQINTKDWGAQIFDLIKLQARLDECRSNVQDFFAVAGKNNLLKQDQGVNVDFYKNRREELKNQIENILANIR